MARMKRDIDVKAIRASLGFTQAQLGDAIGVDQSTVSNWEKGSPPRGPALKLLESLAAKPSSRSPHPKEARGS